MCRPKAVTSFSPPPLAPTAACSPAQVFVSVLLPGSCSVWETTHCGALGAGRKTSALCEFYEGNAKRGKKKKVVFRDEELRLVSSGQANE